MPSQVQLFFSTMSLANDQAPQPISQIVWFCIGDRCFSNEVIIHLRIGDPSGTEHILFSGLNLVQFRLVGLVLFK